MQRLATLEGRLCSDVAHTQRCRKRMFKTLTGEKSPSVFPTGRRRGFCDLTIICDHWSGLEATFTVHVWNGCWESSQANSRNCRLPHVHFFNFEMEWQISLRDDDIRIHHSFRWLGCAEWTADRRTDCCGCRRSFGKWTSSWRNEASSTVFRRNVGEPA